ncbi:TnsA endonuclease N-terminal domain-containing protein, partial [Vibrio cyclitrophicus]
FLYLEHDKNVVEIYEQYPLPIHETLLCAEELNIWHPARYKEKDHTTRLIPATTMTTDLVAVIKNEGSTSYRLQPYNYKPSESLSTKHESTQRVNRTKKKFDIECRYWEKQGFRLVQMTEQDLNPNRVYNLKWLRECYPYPNLLNAPEALYKSLLNTLNNNLTEEPDKTLKDQLQLASDTHNIPLDQTMRLFQHASYNGDISVDLNTKIELYRPLTMLNEVTNAH